MGCGEDTPAKASLQLWWVKGSVTPSFPRCAMGLVVCLFLYFSTANLALSACIMGRHYSTSCSFI